MQQTATDSLITDSDDEDIAEEITDAGEDAADKVGEAFVTYCDTLRELSGFENVKEGDKLEVVQNENNVIVNDVNTTKVMVFLTKVFEKFKEEMDG